MRVFTFTQRRQTLKANGSAAISRWSGRKKHCMLPASSHALSSPGRFDLETADGAHQQQPHPLCQLEPLFSSTVPRVVVFGPDAHADTLLAHPPSRWNVGSLSLSLALLAQSRGGARAINKVLPCELRFQMRPSPPTSCCPAPLVPPSRGMESLKRKIPG